MGGELREVHAGVAVHAVARVDAQALSHAAQVAEGAVVDGAPRLIIPQVADVAVVPRHCRPTLRARPCTTQGSSHRCCYTSKTSLCRICTLQGDVKPEDAEQRETAAGADDAR